ncbi:YaiO family outer membrane beta-barrel protein [Kaistella pullorum]|uniref:YaiO family outer membrane beta-barrel protein n=1 Tax=Kaistella pullorum TaxID=2763074 RepID=A0ABR8WP99_9FLAO|nr:YaiO family outer membrane beta-barrel protein [Kaistella pullorum]MBD8018893.1 YaiO family outer membrane beta-barrel protein [Kaistella pullorum]
MRKILLSFIFILLYTALSAQELSSDELFTRARNEAFENKNYPAAVELAKQALNQSPDYTDISIFLGRLYTWDKNVAAAREVFQGLEQKEVRDEDFYLAYASLEYWNDNYAKALEILEKGLQYNPKSEALWMLKAKIHNSADQFDASQTAITKILEFNPENAEARAMLIQLQSLTAKNSVGISYGFTHFDTQFDQDWHTAGLSYKRATKLGSVILKGNYAYKFGESGTQVELEAYPRISPTFYLYLGAGFSGDVGIFPKYRTGASLNANLPKSFEAEIGYRQLYFSENILLYTAAIGKYYKNWWFNLRTYITPDSSNISHSYTATARYYTKGAQDYFSVQAGTGISPDDNRNNLLNDDTYKLKTFKLGADYNFSVKKTNLFSVGATWFNQEYRPETRGNQLDVSLGYTKLF